MAGVKIKKSFTNIWEDMGARTKANIVNEYVKKTGNNRNTFAHRRRGLFTADKTEWDLIENIFKKYGYKEIWD